MTIQQNKQKKYKVKGFQGGPDPINLPSDYVPGLGA